MKLSTQNISFQLGRHCLLQDISTVAMPGTITGLVGPNGAGKTTLLKIMAGLTKPTSGVIKLGNTELKHLSIADRAKYIAYVPQSRVIHWPVTVRVLVGMGRIAHQSSQENSSRNSPHLCREIIDDTMRQMQVEHLADRDSISLSGGEQARVLLTRALAQQPKILLADEPTSALDIRHQIKLMEQLRELANSGLTIIVSLHDLSQIARYCNHVVLLDQGELIVQGTPQDTLTHQNIVDIYGVTIDVSKVNGVPVYTPLSAIK